MKHAYVAEAFHVEATACLQALQRAADLGIRRVMLDREFFLGKPCLVFNFFCKIDTVALLFLCCN
jgi:hypothetical protein